MLQLSRNTINDSLFSSKIRFFDNFFVCLPHGQKTEHVHQDMELLSGGIS